VSIAVLFAVLYGVMKMPQPPSTQFTQLIGNRAEPVEIWKARKLIQAHSDEALSLTKVAKFANISPNHLSDKFKEVTGVNFVDYIARTRTEKAGELIQNSNLRICEIAFAVGFQSLSQFNRVFKRRTGKSPTTYRAMHATLLASKIYPKHGPNIFRKNA
jgi:AraC-like DNA-binding protein